MTGSQVLSDARPPDLMVYLVAAGIQWVHQNNFRTPPVTIEAAITVVGTTAINTPVYLSALGQNGKPELVLPFKDVFWKIRPKRLER